jgi:hypothetical protein
MRPRTFHSRLFTINLAVLSSYTSMKANWIQGLGLMGSGLMMRQTVGPFG